MGSFHTRYTHLRKVGVDYGEAMRRAASVRAGLYRARVLAYDPVPDADQEGDCWHAQNVAIGWGGSEEEALRAARAKSPAGYEQWEESAYAVHSAECCECDHDGLQGLRVLPWQAGYLAVYDGDLYCPEHGEQCADIPYWEYPALVGGCRGCGKRVDARDADRQDGFCDSCVVRAEAYEHDVHEQAHAAGEL